MNTTLKYILEFASYQTPVIARDMFTQREEVDFEYLCKNGFLAENGKLARSIMRYGDPISVQEDDNTHEFVYWDGGDREVVPPEVLTEFEFKYTPIAKMAGKKYCDDEDIECLVPNAMWSIGVPTKGNVNIYLARNIGSDPAVRDKVAGLPAGDVVLWFGKRPPERGLTEATLVQLSKFLTWNNGIALKDQLPAAFGMSVESHYINAIVHRGKGLTYDFWFNGTGPITISKCAGSAYLAQIIKAGSNGLPLLEVVTGRKIGGVDISREDKEAHGMSPELALKRLTPEQRRVYESLLEQLKDDLDEAKANEEDDDVIQDKENKYNTVKKLLNEKRNFEDGFSNIIHLVRMACTTALCKALVREGLPDLAAHLKETKVLSFGTYCKYQPPHKVDWTIK